LNARLLSSLTITPPSARPLLVSTTPLPISLHFPSSSTKPARGRDLRRPFKPSLRSSNTTLSPIHPNSRHDPLVCTGTFQPLLPLCFGWPFPSASLPLLFFSFVMYIREVFRTGFALAYSADCGGFLCHQSSKTGSPFDVYCDCPMQGCSSPSPSPVMIFSS
jgi:hypothetical protein